MQHSANSNSLQKEKVALYSKKLRYSSSTQTSNPQVPAYPSHNLSPSQLLHTKTYSTLARQWTPLGFLDTLVTSFHLLHKMFIPTQSPRAPFPPMLREKIKDFLSANSLKLPHSDFFFAKMHTGGLYWCTNLQHRVNSMTYDYHTSHKVFLLFQLSRVLSTSPI